MDEKFYADLRERIKPYFEEGGCHEWDHTERVLNLSLEIGKRLGADLGVLKISSLLHDIAHEEQDKSGGRICHAERGAEIAESILRELDYTKINEVVSCIRTHRFRNGKLPLSLEAKILYDADKLDSIGAIGILRAASFSGKIGSKVHNPNVDLGTTEDYHHEDNAYREFLIKLSKIKDKMLTEEGRRIAGRRHEYMVDFFNRANSEVRGEL